MHSAEWYRKQRGLKSVISFDRLCQDFGAETLEDFQERIMRYGDGCYHTAYTEAIRTGSSEEEAERLAQEAEAAELGDANSKYINAVEKVATKLYKEHNLVLTETKKDSLFYRITPEVSWKDSADCIRITINGIGMFGFSSVQESLRSGPYTPRQCVLSHLHHIPATVWSMRIAKQAI